MAVEIDRSGRSAVVFGVANHRSIAWAIAQHLHYAGAHLTVTYQNERMGRSVLDLVKGMDRTTAVECDVLDEASVYAAVAAASLTAPLAVAVHSVAFANKDDLEGEFSATGVEGFRTALEVSAYSFLPVARAAAASMEGGGSILTLTSHAIRTSPVLRGKWILNNILGTPPPDPPPNIPALDDRKTQARVATVRERLSAHRANPVCAACHSMIDPAGFALEGFDAIGRARVVDESFNRLDTSGVLPDGTAFDGVAELREALVARPDRFVGTVTEKLMTYALGRGLGHYDMPAVRRIVRDAAASDYSMQSIIVGIVNSYPFLHRRSES